MTQATRTRIDQTGLKGARGVFAASVSVTRREFDAYVATCDLASAFPGITGIGFIQRIQRRDLNGFAATERGDDAPDFQIHGPGVLNATDDSAYVYVTK